jgi:hypothetical protein
MGRAPSLRSSSASTDPAMMMMSFNCSCRNKNEPNAIYPLGTPPGDKEGTCDYAVIMFLMAP